MKREWPVPARYIALVVIFFLLVAAAWYLRGLFEPLVVAALIAYILDPVVAFLCRRTRLSHRAAANLVFFISLALIIAIPSTLLPTLVDEIQTVTTDLIRILDQIQIYLAEPVTFGGMTLHLELFVPALKESLSGLLAPLPEDALRLLEVTSRGAAWFLVIVAGSYYFLMDWERLRDWMIRLAPDAYRSDVRRLYLEVQSVWMAYLRGQITLMIIVGVVFAIVWSAIGLPGALILGLLSGLFSLVPEIGPLVATLIALVVALLEGSNFLPISNLWFALLVGGLYVVLINIKSIWLRPHVLGRSVRMHEGLVFISIIAAVVFFGILGALIVVPVLASLGVIGRYLRARILGIPPFPMAESMVAESRPEPPPQRRRKGKPSPSSKKRKG